MKEARVYYERLFNHCEKCGVRIPWRARAVYGNVYRPVVCVECAVAAASWNYTSRPAGHDIP